MEVSFRIQVQYKGKFFGKLKNFSSFLDIILFY